MSERRLINVEEYYKMAEVGILTEHDRVELIQGEIIEKSPISSKHAAAVNRFSNVLIDLIFDFAIVRVQNPIKINAINEPEPDVVILKYKDDFYAEKHPGPDDIRIVIEVADTTLAYDREIKLPLYASVGIPEFWLVDLAKNEIEVHRSPSVDIYKRIEICRPGDSIYLPTFETSVEADLLLGNA